MASRTLRITLLASEWKSSKGGLSTMNRELAIHLAKHPSVSVSFLVPECSDKDKREAGSCNVKIVEAEERPGFEPVVWLAFPPKDLATDFVIGHGVILGKQAQIIRGSHHCKWIQVVHTAPEELAMYKAYSDAIPKGGEKQWNELKLCRIADRVVAVGPKLHEFYSAYLSSSGKDVYNFTPGIFTELSILKVSSQMGKKFRILVFGRGDSEDFELKGFDIAAQAVAKLNDKSYHLTFVGAPSGSETQVTNELLKQGLCRSQLIVKGYLENREYLNTLLCASNLAIIPSRTEGFGLTALEALSIGLPFLVSQNSGFGEAIQDIGSSFIVDSEDPEHWAEAIKGVREKGSEAALQECRKLRARYAEKYSWETQCSELLDMMLNLFQEPPLRDSLETQSSTEHLGEAEKFTLLHSKSACPIMAEVATREPVNIPSFDNAGAMVPFCTIISVPSYPEKKFDAHDGEVNAARFSVSGKLFATGGADRKVKIWEQVNGNYTLKGIMHGSNAGIMSVEFDSQEKLILAASHDGASRVWTLADQRLRHTLTGHFNKVKTAKFFGGATTIVSGSHDRTLKIWDLRSRQCTKTIFAGSSCNDIVINEGTGSQVASGHFDKTVRFWDVRTDNQSSVGEIKLQGKVTSLDLSPDMNCMLASTAGDDTVKLLDLRMNQVMSTCSADGFKVAVDYTRASFSPDGQFVICGSQDGSIFVWDRSTAKLDKILKEHTSSVVACAWHPDGSSIISCDRNKCAIIWTNRY